ncbi:hypothetical protein BYT27DRAFT_7255565 [Phlegmacium glaucopus]|nr:hypothetical protein BYT27DRAFT_7255565 [Phlegmacium glaucopus]
MFIFIFFSSAYWPIWSVTGWSATMWKRVKSSSEISVDRRSLGSSSTLLNDASPTEEAQTSSLGEPSANITLPISSTLETISAPQSAQSLSTFTSQAISATSPLSTGITQTPFTSETVMTESAISTTPPSSSASPITPCLSPSSSSLTLPMSSVAVVPLSTVRPPSPSCTMSYSGTITVAPVDPTPTTTDSTMRPGSTQSGLDTTPAIISTTSSTPSITPASTTFLPTFPSTTFLPPIPSASSSLTRNVVSYPSIPAISISIPADDPTVTPTSTSVSDQTITANSTVGTGVLSTDTPHNAGFAHRTGAIIGVGIAGTFGLILIALLIFFAFKRYQSNRLDSSMDGFFAVSHNTPWRPPLEEDDQERYSAAYGRTMSQNPRIPASQGHGGAGFFGDRISVEDGGGGSVESVDASGALLVNSAPFGSQPRMPPVGQTLHGSTNSRGPSTSHSYSSNGSHDTSRPWWSNTEPLNINKRNSQPPPRTVDSHVSAVGSRSTSSLGLGGGSFSIGYHSPGSSGEALIPRGNTRTTSIIEPRPIHNLDGRRPPPTAFLLRHVSSLKYGAQKVQQHQEEQKEEQKQQDRADKSISQAILARIRASRAPSTVKAYSQSTTIRSEESSRAPSYTYSPSLLNPPISIPQTLPNPHLPPGATGNSYTPDNTFNQYPHHRQGVGDTSEGLLWPGVSLSYAPSPAPTDDLSMVEGLLHPRLGTVLARSQQASTASLRDHEDYSRPINGLVNNHIRSTTTFDTQDTVDSDEGVGRAI